MCGYAGIVYYAAIMAPALEDDDDVELVPIPMDRETRTRLVRFAKAIGKPPVDAAGSLLSTLLVDDEFWNAAAHERLN